MIRAVLDANIFASAFIQSKGPSGCILRLFVDTRTFELVTPQPILDEAERCLFYPRVRKRIALTNDAIHQALAAIGLLADVVTTDLELDVVVQDPDDNKILAAAVEGKAEYVVTGDTDLLTMKVYEGIRIIPPAQFLKILETLPRGSTKKVRP
jgi:putative PIN family toxin of toxin-antitoxin system